jgi:hypothetical protein
MRAFQVHGCSFAELKTETMKIKIMAFKRKKGCTDRTRKTVVHIVLVDQEKSKKYPDNFVCVMPAQLGFPSALFEKIYGDRSREAAIGFFNEALKQEQDPEIKKEIQSRINALSQRK